MDRYKEYCNLTTDLQEVCKKIESYAYEYIDTSYFEAVSGQDYSKQGQVGYVGALYINRNEQPQASGLSTINDTNTWYYDTDNDILYVYTDAISTNEFSITSSDWKTLKENAREKASQELERYLYLYPTPIPFMRNSENEYDADIIRACAIITCRLLVEGNNWQDPLREDLYNAVYEPDNGILWQYVHGNRQFSFDATRSTMNGLVYADSSNTGSGQVFVAGQAQDLDYFKYEIEFTTGGEPKTAVYTLTENNVVIGSKNTYIHYVNLGLSNIWIRLSGQFEIGDKFTIEFDGRINKPKTGLRVLTMRRD